MSHLKIEDIKDQIASIKEKLEKDKMLLGMSADELEEHGRRENLNYEHVTENCEHHGEYRSVSFKVNMLKSKSVDVKTGCINCKLAKLETLNEDLEVARERRRDIVIGNRLGEAGIPARFEGASLSNYHPTGPQAERALRVCAGYAKKWLDRKEAGGGLVLCGTPGTGKTHLAVGIMRHVITEYLDSARMTTALRIARRVKATWSKDSEWTEDDIISQYITPDLLVIDELGVQFGSEAEKMILFEVINGRYNDMKPTILISNLDTTELGEFIGERVIDRMCEGGGYTLAFDWESYRRRAQA